MKKMMSRLLSLVLCVSLLCSLAPVALAAGGESFRFYYEFDKTSYKVGEEVNVKVMVERTDNDEDYNMYSYSLNAVFKDLNLEYVSGSASATDELIITSTPTDWQTGYKYVVLSYNPLNPNKFVQCGKTTEIATLTFTAKAEVNGVVMLNLLPSISVRPGETITPTTEAGSTVIGNPAAPTYKISFEANGGTGTAPVIEDKAEGNQFVIPPNQYTWDNHTFIGWNDGNKTYQPGETYTMPGRNVVFTAQWRQDTYTITFAPGDGATGQVPDARQLEPTAVTRLPNENTLTKSGYTFEGWLCSSDNKTYKVGDEFTMPESDVTFTAVWKENDKPAPSPGGNGSGSGGVTSYPVTVNAPANGTVSADKKSAASGATVTITVTPETGYKVGSVTVKDKNGNTIAATEKDGKYSFKMPASAVSVDVTFVKDGGSSVGDCPKDSTCPVDPFKDTSNTAWWHDGIHYCVEQGLMNGVASDQFAPNGATTRAMIVTILWRMEGSPATSYSMSFTDVPAGQWYTEAIRWAQSTGVVTGYDAQTFGPNNNVTREQLAAILYRYTAHKGGDVSQRSTLAQFTDVSQISSWALENIQWANAVDMVNGRTDTTIVPKGNATRAEAASMIQRFCQNVLKL